MTSILFGTVQHREQINQLTAYIDASQVYGYSYEFARDLRDVNPNVGLLRTGIQVTNQKALLPFASPTDGIDCRKDHLEETKLNCFTAGDIRVNEQIGLTAMHTIWYAHCTRTSFPDICIDILSICTQSNGGPMANRQCVEIFEFFSFLTQLRIFGDTVDLNSA